MGGKAAGFCAYADADADVYADVDAVSRYGADAPGYHELAALQYESGAPLLDLSESRETRVAAFTRLGDSDWKEEKLRKSAGWSDANRPWNRPGSAGASVPLIVCLLCCLSSWVRLVSLVACG